jgi:hypothetical protein
LRSGDSFCCLGVLCEVALAEGVIGLYEPTAAFPPPRVVEWAELPSEDPKAGNVRLTIANDNGHTFRQIASLIEERM